MKIVYSLLCVIFLLACDKKKSENDDSLIKNKLVSYEKVEDFQLNSPPPDENQSNKPSIPTTQADSITKIIKEGEISFSTRDIKFSILQLKKVITQYKGYISSDNLQINGDKIQNNVTIRIPAKYLDCIVDSITNIAGNLDSKRIASEDVTATYVDSEARLITKKALEKRYLELLTKATKVSDMIQIEEQISNLREEIESAEGRLRIIKNQISLSTLEITIYEFHSTPSPLFAKIKDAFTSGWNGFIEFCMIFIYGWVFILFSLIGWGFYRFYKLSRKR
ncbi:MAG: DUF4349 domain-containing protein [Sediminibacterium sp.]|nr:DUF4349 domain-containing protein [Sediminibacterium sp.]